MQKRRKAWISLRSFLLGMGVMYVIDRFRHRGELQWVQQIYEEELRRYVPFGRRAGDRIAEVPDPEIEAQVAPRLAEHGVQIRHLYVRVREGVITLHGDVDADQKRRVAAILGGIPGVRGVELHLASPAPETLSASQYH